MTCRAWPVISESDAHAARALEARGVTVTGLAWNDTDARFSGFDAAIFRSSWDYHHAPEAYLSWLARWEGAGVRFWNPPDLVRWNLTKRYLLDLGQRGVSVVPTVVLDEPASSHLPAVLAGHGWRQAVVKPLIGASGHDATLVGPGDVHAVAAAIDGGRIRRPVLVQPFVEAIATRGECSMIFIEGEMTHAVLKQPAAGDFRVQSSYGGTLARAVPSRAMAAVAQQALAALPAAPLYARLDCVEAETGVLVMEVEVHEPGLFFGVAPEGAVRLADAIVRRL